MADPKDGDITCDTSLKAAFDVSKGYAKDWANALDKKYESVVPGSSKFLLSGETVQNLNAVAMTPVVWAGRKFGAFNNN